MSSNTFALQSWLDEMASKGELTAEERKSLGDILGARPKAIEYVKSGYLAQSDYSRAMDALRTKETELQADADAKVQKELAEIAKYRGESDTNFQAAVAKRVEAEQALIAVRAQIESLQRDYALPNDAVDPILKGVPQRSAADDEAARRRAEAERQRSTELDSRYLSREEFTKQVPAWKRVPIEYQRVAGEYQSLFKSDPYLGDATGKCAMDRIVERHEKDNVPLREAFEREFNVVAKREEVRQAEKAAEIAAAVADAEKRVRSQIAAENPGINAGRTAKLPGSPALSVAGVPERQKDSAGNTIPFQRVNSAQAHQDRVSRAVSSFNENLEKSLAS